jgi:hypothetical protein
MRAFLKLARVLHYLSHAASLTPLVGAADTLNKRPERIFDMNNLKTTTLRSTVAAIIGSFVISTTLLFAAAGPVHVAAVAPTTISAQA